MTKDEIYEVLHISEGDYLQDIFEKLFCLALLQEGTETVSKVLRRYNDIKRGVFENGKLR